MSRKFLTSINMAQNQLIGAVIENLASAPSSPVEGQIYYDTTLHQFGVRNNSAWVYLGSGGGTVTALSVVTANGFAGTVANPSTTPAITLTVTATGILKGNGTAISAAVSGTDYAPATTGTGILKGNGSGGFSTAASGTDYAPATTGSSALKGNGSGGFAAATLNDVGAATAAYSLNGQKITSLADPTSAQDAATKAYVDAASIGIDFKPSVRAATITALPTATYANGTSGVGATLTASANGALSAQDGVTLVAGDRILVKNQSTAAQNGIYTVTQVGNAGAPFTLTRATDSDTSTELTSGSLVFVEEGTVNGGQQWILTTTGAITIGTTSQTWTQFSGASTTTAGGGLTATGNVFAVGAGTGIIVNADSVQVDRTNNGTIVPLKYSADIGNGSLTAITVTHNLGTKDVHVQVRENSTDAVVECDIVMTSTNVVTLTFATAPATNAYRVVVIG